jgi:hypothetical protein
LEDGRTDRRGEKREKNEDIIVFVVVVVFVVVFGKEENEQKSERERKRKRVHGWTDGNEKVFGSCLRTDGKEREGVALVVVLEGRKERNE